MSMRKSDKERMEEWKYITTKLIYEAREEEANAFIIFFGFIIALVILAILL